MKGFHITSKKNIPSIMSEGLIPSLGFLSDMIMESRPAVFMFKELSEVDYAMNHWYGDFIRYMYPEKDLRLLQVDLPEDFEVEERYGWELVSYRKIPAGYLSKIEFPEGVGIKKDKGGGKICSEL